MDEAMYSKFRQHANVREILFSTGDRELELEDADDDFWGIGTDGRGRNEMGKSLMRVRDRLRRELTTG